MLEISIVIVAYNAKYLIKNCLDSIFTQIYNAFEVIIIDNGSKDDTVGFIKENYTGIKLIENKENLGAARARNQGISIAQGKWILTLDCDIILEKDFLTKIIRFVKETEGSVGIFQPKILNMDKKTIYSCGIYSSRLRRFYDVGKGRFDYGQFNTSKYIFGACSAAALYNRRMLEDIKENTGYFDERFFFLLEDVDLSWRAQRRGWKGLFYPGGVCYHLGNSSQTPKDVRQYLCWRNRDLFLEKCRLNRFELSIISLFYDLPRLAFLFLMNSYVRNAIKNKSVELNGEKTN